MWKPSSLMEAAERGCCGCIDTTGTDDGGDGAEGYSDVLLNRSQKFGGGNYSFQPYAYPRSSLSDWERVMCKSTIEDYQRHFNLKIGVYVQEFSISAEALDALSNFVNKHGALYDQGLAFGGINGMAVKNIDGDRYWNQASIAALVVFILCFASQPLHLTHYSFYTHRGTVLVAGTSLPDLLRR